MVYKMEIIKILALIFLCAVICVIFKSYKPEYSFVIIVFCSVIVLSFIVKNLIAPLNIIEQKISESGINSGYFKTALKAMGIGYITSFIADSCTDAGLTALASKAQFAGKCAIFLLSVPLALSILETAIGFVK